MLSVLAAVSHLLAGCATQIAIPPNPAVGPRAHYGRVEALGATAQPEARLEPVLRTKGQAAGTGAASGALVGVGELGRGLASCGGAYCGAAFLVLLPVFIAAGAITGAAVAAAGAEGKHIVDAGDRAIRDGMERLQLQLAVASGAQKALAARGTPAGADARVETDVRALAVRESFAPGANTPRYELALTTHARLVAGTKVVDELTYTDASRSLTAREWLADDARLFLEEMREAVRRTSEALVDELLLYYPPAPQAGEEGSPLVPYYALRPLYPEPVRSFDVRGAWFERYRQSWGALQYVPVDSLEPVFRWEAFPRPVDLAAFGGAAGRFSEVSYELALYEAERIGVIYERGRLLYRRAGLREPHYRLEQLRPCGRYVWSVRASFLLDGQPRVTEWSGAYNAFANQQPWESRRGLQTTGLMRWGLAPERLYLPFRTPGC